MHDYVGKKCPYCKTIIQDGEDCTICDVCGMPHHKNCWDENHGCTTFGCTKHDISNEPISLQQPVASISPNNLPQRRKSLISYLKSVRHAAKTDLTVAIPLAKAMYICGGVIVAALSIYKIQSVYQFDQEA